VTAVISQGSAATQLRCGGQCNKYFVANLLPNSTVKKFWKSVNICQSYRQNIEVPFLTHKDYSKVPLLHGHRHEVVNAAGRSCHHDSLLQTVSHVNTASDHQQLAPSPNKRGPASYPHLVVNRVEVGAVGRLQIGSSARRNLSLWVTRPSHRHMSRWVHCDAEKWISRQKLHRYRAASPVSAACPDNTLHLFWCQGPLIWGG